MKHLLIFSAIFISICVLPSCGYSSSHQQESSSEVVIPEVLTSNRVNSPDEHPIIPPVMAKSKHLFPITDKPKSQFYVEAKAPANSPRVLYPSSQPSKKKSRADRREPKKSVPVGQRRIAHKSLSLSELRKKYDGTFKLSGPVTEKKVALTFDDGPDEIFTRLVLDVLKQNKIKATFFVIGRRAEAHPELIVRMIREGHTVGNHSYNHADLSKLSVLNFEKQIEHTQSILKPMTGYNPKLFRPPYGAINEQQVRWAMDHGYLVINWNVDSLDWKGLSADKVSHNILSANRPGAIILQHCGGGEGEDLSGSVKALPTIIRTLKSQGYEMVTVPDLLHVSKNK
jgi:peptidoglycan/xylan/chitin deacetylase (PgdA/CDA1 family)